MQKSHRAPTPDAIAPDGIAIRHLIDEAQGAKKLSLAEGALGPGQRSAKVYHTTYEEIWYVLQGEGIFRLHMPGVDTEESTQVRPGDALLVPPHHGFWVGEYRHGRVGLPPGWFSALGNWSRGPPMAASGPVGR